MLNEQEIAVMTKSVLDKNGISGIAPGDVWFTGFKSIPGSDLARGQLTYTGEDHNGVKFSIYVQMATQDGIVGANTSAISDDDLEWMMRDAHRRLMIEVVGKLDNRKAISDMYGLQGITKREAVVVLRGDTENDDHAAY